MLLREITYSLLELIREGSIVDDERLDVRLLEQLVHAKRADYVKSLADSNKPVAEDYYQYFNLDILGKTIQDRFTYVFNTELTPKIAFSRYGPLIAEVTHLNNPLHCPYRMVNNQHFRFTGHGRFNKGLVYVTYRDGRLYLKSNDNVFSYISEVGVKAVLENPSEISEFNADTDNYPITYDAYEYIKKAVLTEDIRVFVSGQADEVNNASGNIET